jgi:proton-translocating NADH-quinone oxidoreductase chain N
MSVDFLSLQWQALMPELVVGLFALIAPILAVYDTDRAGMRQFTLIGLGGAFLMALGSLFDLQFRIPIIDLDFSLVYIGADLGVLKMTYASQLFKVLFLAIAFVAVLGIGRPLKGRAEEDWGEFCSLILFATLGMLIVASSQELITLVLGIELASMSSYILAGFRRDAVGAEASLKYFTIGAISSGLLLFGVSLVYGMAGTTSIPEIVALAKAGGFASFDAFVIIPIVMLLAGLGFKISSVPFHAWAPDVYSGAPTPVVGMLASGSKAMGFVAVFNVFVVGLAGIKSDWHFAIAAVAAASILFGNLVALQQTSIRRMLAYSSIAQAGYVLIAVAVGQSAQDQGVYALGGGIFHLITNSAMKLGAFLIVGALLWAGIPDTVESWRGLGRRSPVFAFAMTLFLLSMAGLPPLGGFASKFVLFSGAIDAGANSGMGWLVWLAVVAIVGSAVSLYYYLRVIRAMVVEEGEPSRVQVPPSTVAAVVVCAVAIVLMGVWPQPFMDASFRAAASMLGLAS